MTSSKPVSALATVGVLLLLTLAGTTPLRGQVLNSNLPPGGNFNLTNWYLGLPVDSTNGTAGGSASILATQLIGGYSNALYFYTGPDGAMTFWARVDGATTEGSSYPRSELREQIIPGENNINWRGYGTHLLTAICKVTEVSSTKKVIIGQIHTKTGDARPLVKLQYNNGTIEALVKIYPDDNLSNADHKFYYQNVGLNNDINYAIQLENGLVTVTVNGLSQSTNSFLSHTNWAPQEFYFKAGSYCQDNVGPSSEGARVAFYSLARSHAPSITNQPASITVAAGSNTNLGVQATGNGTLTYQWRRNGTNLTVNATSATLNLTNVQTTNAGDYSVRVTDTLGAVTSVVATLTVIGPPSITSQPTNQWAESGASASFSVTASGTGTLGYQWQKDSTNLVNGGNLSGTTSNVLAFVAVTPGDAANYRVVVTNAYGSVTSAVVSLTVTNAATNNPPTFTSDPINKTNATVAVAYNGTLAGDATDPDPGEILTFSKVSGPAWLSVAGNGTLSGTPGAGDVGTNNWTIRVTDLASASNQATLKIIVSAAPSGGTVTNVIVDDSWADAGRDNGADALDTDWWSSTSSSGNSIEVYSGQLGLISGGSGRGLHGIFASQSLAVDDTLTASFDFTTPATVGTAKPAGFRIGLFDTTGHIPGLQADLTASTVSPNANYNNLSGYMMDLDVNTGTEDITFRERTNTLSGQLLAATGDFESLSGGGNAYTFAANTTYRGVISITRTGAGSLALKGELYQGVTPLSTHTASDASGITAAFGMLAFHVGSSTFGSFTSAGQAVDNGITFTNIKIAVVTPETSITSPTLDIALSGNNVVLSWITNGTAGFVLESATNVAPPIVWTAAGTSTVVGEKHHVTNSLTGGENYYRLKKP